MVVYNTGGGGGAIHACQIIMTNYNGNKHLNKDFSQCGGLGPMYLSILDLFVLSIYCVIVPTIHSIVINGLEADNAIMRFNNNMMKANPENFQIMFLCPPKYIEPFQDIFSVSDIEINRQHT